MQPIISPFERKQLVHIGQGVYEIAPKQSDKQKDLLMAKRASTNRDAAQQSFLIGILIMNGFSIKLKKLYKKGKTTSQLFVVEEISRDGNIYFEEIMSENSEEDKKKKRRNADAKTNDCLLELASTYCWAQFDFKKGKQSVVCSQMRRIQTAQVGQKLFVSDLITNSGREINHFILSQMSKKGCVLSPNNAEILSCF